jgi:hypothetical protein
LVFVDQTILTRSLFMLWNIVELCYGWPRYEQKCVDYALCGIAQVHTPLL